MSGATPTKVARVKYPNFHVTAMVSASKHGSLNALLAIRAFCYCNHKDEMHHPLINDAKWKLSQAGVSDEQLAELYFEVTEFTRLHACDARRARQSDDGYIEAFFYWRDMPKADVLVRQRRALPGDRIEMLDLYGPKVTEPTTEGQPA